MINLIQTWKSWSRTTRFSVIAFVLTAALGLLSMGLLGFGLYYLVYFGLTNFPNESAWHGDWVWPTLISVGMFWSVGFIFSGVFHHFFCKKLPTFISCTIYLIILWLWAFILWYGTLSAQD